MLDRKIAHRRMFLQSRARMSLDRMAFFCGFRRDKTAAERCRNRHFRCKSLGNLSVELGNQRHELGQNHAGGPPDVIGLPLEAGCREAEPALPAFDVPCVGRID